MKIRFLSGLILSSLTTCTALAQDTALPTLPDQSPPRVQPSQAPPETSPSTGQPVAADDQPRSDEMNLRAVPNLLRMHLPQLGPDMGLLVESVAPDSAPAKIGIRQGDILIEAGGRTLFTDATLAQVRSDFPILVIRRGQVVPLHPRSDAFFGLADAMPDARTGWHGMRMMPNAMMVPNSPNMPRSGRAVASSSFSGDGQSATFSQAGDQIAIEIQASGGDPIQLRGTRSEIEQRLESDEFPDAAKRQIRSLMHPTR